MTPDPDHPNTDEDATFSAIPPKHTHRVIDALRKQRIYFDVTINGPKEDPRAESYDIFWFQKEDDQDKIKAILRASIPNE